MSTPYPPPPPPSLDSEREWAGEEFWSKTNITSLWWNPQFHLVQVQNYLIWKWRDALWFLWWKWLKACKEQILQLVAREGDICRINHTGDSDHNHIDCDSHNDEADEDVILPGGDAWYRGWLARTHPEARRYQESESRLITSTSAGGEMKYFINLKLTFSSG